MAKDTANTQIYKRRSATSLETVSEVSHKANMTPMLSSDYKSRVKARAEEAEREKKSRKIALIDDPMAASSKMKTSRPATTTTKRTNSSPTTSAIHSPVIVSSPGNDASRTTVSATSISSTLRERVIQLLALKSFKLSLLASMVKASEKDLLHMIRKVNYAKHCIIQIYWYLTYFLSGCDRQWRYMDAETRGLQGNQDLGLESIRH